MTIAKCLHAEDHPESSRNAVNPVLNHPESSDRNTTELTMPEAERYIRLKWDHEEEGSTGTVVR